MSASVCFADTGRRDSGSVYRCDQCGAAFAATPLGRVDEITIPAHVLASHSVTDLGNVR